MGHLMCTRAYVNVALLINLGATANKKVACKQHFN